MMRKFHEAKENSNAPVTFGEAEPMRIFFVDDMAQAVVFALKTRYWIIYNVGTGEDLTIKQLAETIQK
jgi:GDP-L-fucose synthase